MTVTDEDGIKQDVPVLASVASNTRPCFCIPVWPLNHQPIHSKPRYFSRTVCLACLSRWGRRKTTFACRTAGSGDARILRRNARKRRNDAKLLIKNTHTYWWGNCVGSNDDVPPVVVWAKSVRVFRQAAASVAFPPYLAISHSTAATAMPVQLPPMRERLRTSHLIQAETRNLHLLSCPWNLSWYS